MTKQSKQVLKNFIPFVILVWVFILVAHTSDTSPTWIGPYLSWLILRIGMLMMVCFGCIVPCIKRWRRSSLALSIKAARLLLISIAATFSLLVVEYGLNQSGIIPVPAARLLYYQFLIGVYIGFIPLWALIYSLKEFHRPNANEHPKIYAVFQLVGWSIVASYWVFSAQFSMRVTVIVIAWALLISCSSLLISHFILRPYYQHQVDRTSHIFKLLGQSCFLCFACTWLITYIEFIWIAITPSAQRSSSAAMFVLLFAMKSGFLLIWSFLYSTWLLWQIKQNAIQNQLLLEKTLTQARLHSLKQQLNPHFLFNTLNSLRALIVKDQHAAREMVTYLSNLLRFSLYQIDSNTIELESEINAVKQYVDIENIRFNNALKINWLVEPGIEKSQVAPLSIQTLVENSSKHGTKDQGKIIIKILIERSGDLLKIEVANSGKIGRLKGKGIGLNNTRERLKLLFGSQSDVSLREEDNQVVACIKHPYIETQSQE